MPFCTMRTSTCTRWSTTSSTHSCYAPEKGESRSTGRWIREYRRPSSETEPGSAKILTNLVDNALKFTTDGRVHLNVSPVDDDSEVPDCGVQFTVADTGIGIGEEDQASIFDSFRQVDGSATRHYEGTGLGLAIGKSLTDLMGGTIAVRSELGVGSTFTVRLPLSPADATQPATSARLTA